MSIVLGIDTSGVVCAGVAVDGAVAASGVVPDTRAHAEQLMPLVQQVLAEAGLTLAEIDRIAVGVGPGPFTGLRVGVVTAITLGEALGVPVRGVCSLDVLAGQAVEEAVESGRSVVGAPSIAAVEATASFIVAADARRKEWYWASYEADGRRMAGPFVGDPDELPESPKVGPVTERPIALDAGVLAAIADDLPDAGLEPLYLRRPDAEVPTARKSTLLPPRLAPRRIR
ncbi:MAG: tRNA (adenosine(37)-N6)-threonylcarbamoyltransferase complex dimerization subunit type 1 TsaB [Propionicimonas sp.]